MKRILLIYTLFLTTSFLLSSSAQSQEQRKPSERSFTAEMNKVKQIQAARNTKISQIQQPVDTTTAAARNDNKTGTTPATNKITPDPSKNLLQNNTTTKPSGGPMKKPKKPSVTSGIIH